MLPRRTLNSVKERGSNGALRSHVFAKGRTRRGGSRRNAVKAYQLTLNQIASERDGPPSPQCEMRSRTVRNGLLIRESGPRRG